MTLNKQSFVKKPYNVLLTQALSKQGQKHGCQIKLCAKIKICIKCFQLQMVGCWKGTTWIIEKTHKTKSTADNLPSKLWLPTKSNHWTFFLLPCFQKQKHNFNDCHLLSDTVLSEYKTLREKRDRAALESSSSWEGFEGNRMF